MSFAYYYFFDSDSALDEFASAFNDALAANLQPQEDDPTIYVGRILGMGYDLTHNYVDEDYPVFNEYPYSIMAKIWAPENDLLYIHPSLFFSMIYMMYRRLEVKKGLWAGDSLQTIAKYDYVRGDDGWDWYDLTNGCIAGYSDEHIEDYLMRVFPRSIEAG